MGGRVSAESSGEDGTIAEKRSGRLRIFIAKENKKNLETTAMEQRSVRGATTQNTY
ncbi:hypothetical protein PaeBR_14340 [Paenibacillus sp. BR2-3]|uniref:hypothetical protein n=1 Tax=Paenibacillus sp. BR2-3 TaxID=3048494 RepID=UPI003977C881